MISTCLPERPSPRSHGYCLPDFQGHFMNLHSLLRVAMILALLCIGRCLGAPPWFDKIRTWGEGAETMGLADLHKSTPMLTKPLTYTQLQSPAASWNFVCTPFWFQRAFKMTFFTLYLISVPWPSPSLTLLASQALHSPPARASSQVVHMLCQEYSVCTAPQTLSPKHKI